MSKTVLSLTAPREALLAAVDSAARPVERKNTIPVLANLLFDTAGDGETLRVSGTDLDVMSAIDTGLGIDEMPDEGVTVPAVLLGEILRKLPARAEVSLKASAHGQLALACGRSRFTLATLPGGDWPRLEENTAPQARFEMPPAKLNAMLAAVSYAISTEETRYYLNGVYMHCAGDQLVTVATDGHRLARATIAAADGAQAMPGIIIPRKTVTLLAKALGAADKQATLKIAVSENRISFELGAVRIASKLIDGTFPDYGRVIPEGNANQWRFDVAALTAATDRVSTISSDRGRAVKLVWGRETLELLVINPDTGDGREDMLVSTDDADDVTIGFNARYLGEMLSHMSGQAQVALADGGAPARFTPVHNDDDEIALTFVLMPMRVS